MSLDATFAAFVTGERADLSGLLGDVWRHGFHAGVARMRPKLDALGHEADRLYLATVYSRAEIEAMDEAAADETYLAAWQPILPPDPDPAAAWPRPDRKQVA